MWGHEVFPNHTGRVGSGRFGSGQEIFILSRTGSGHPNPTRPDPARPDPLGLIRPVNTPETLRNSLCALTCLTQIPDKTKRGGFTKQTKQMLPFWRHRRDDGLIALNQSITITSSLPCVSSADHAQHSENTKKTRDVRPAMLEIQSAETAPTAVEHPCVHLAYTCQSGRQCNNDCLMLAPEPKR